jgi:predicted PurR-regulated permease PerM
MPASEASPSHEAFLTRAVETTVRIGTVLLLAAWCLEILRPFVIPVAWGIIIAVAVHPAYVWLERALGGRTRLAAAIFSGVAVLLIIVPAVVGAGSLLGSGQELAGQLREEAIEIPPPPDSVADWPVVGEPIHSFWSLASVNLGEAARQVAPQLQALGAWLLAAGAGTGLALVQFVIALIIAGVLLASASTGIQAAQNIATRMAGDRGEKFAALAGATVRSVAVGIVGVALIQSALIGLGFVVAGVPHAALWTVLCLFLAVLQLPTFIVVAPIVVYMFSHSTTTAAVLFAIWCTLATLSDNVLKPILLARGVETPMIVIFMGAIGGFVSAGFIGLFVGAVILSLGYELFMAWVDGGGESAADADEATA